MKIKTDNYEIYKDDCLEVMKSIPSESVGLVVTDPPYLMNYQSNYRKRKYEKIANDINSHELIIEYFKECYRILENNSAIYCFCSWHNVDFLNKNLRSTLNLKTLSYGIKIIRQWVI